MKNAKAKGILFTALSALSLIHIYIGVTCKLDKEIEFYTSGAFQPTDITFHNKTVDVFGSTGVVLTDCDYTLLLNGQETTHHFMVTEVYNKTAEEWKLVTFSFTALVY